MANEFKGFLPMSMNPAEEAAKHRARLASTPKPSENLGTSATTPADGLGNSYQDN